MRATIAATTSKTAQLRRLTAALLVGILTLAAGTLTVGARADDVESRWQPPETIAAAATGVGNVEAVAIDERLKLNRCARPLDAKIERRSHAAMAPSP
jgi:hypothetical protein